MEEGKGREEIWKIITLVCLGRNGRKMKVFPVNLSTTTKLTLSDTYLTTLKNMSQIYILVFNCCCINFIIKWFSKTLFGF